MKLANLKNRKNAKKFVVLPIISVLFIGCGGGGGGGGSSGPSIPNNYPNYPNNSPNNNHIAPPVVLPAVSLPHNPSPVSPLAPLPSGIIQGTLKGTENLDSNLVDTKKDEKKIMNIGVVDTFFYESKKFQRRDGTSRINITQARKDSEDKRHHGTMVTHMIVKYNKDANIFAQSTGLSRNSNVIFTTEKNYQDLYNKGIRIFNNSYGYSGTDNGVVGKTFPNVARYAAKDSIFIWSAGNESKLNASPDALHPYNNPSA
ncbi:S8 family serine peptidase, partial [Campylobacter pinnipediorum]|uniref:S8 family serine peptidase n=1 Tax=Campylobacter pinnipediorum TaxID=1965231 RepID=UPI00112FBA07